MKDVLSCRAPELCNVPVVCCLLALRNTYLGSIERSYYEMLREDNLLFQLSGNTTNIVGTPSSFSENLLKFKIQS
jgi:hypothetical protein